MTAIVIDERRRSASTIRSTGCRGSRPVQAEDLSGTIRLTNAPTMNMSPWAKLMSSMIP